MILDILNEEINKKEDVMNVYFDTEFTGLTKDTELISIGLVPEDNSKPSFYAEITDYDSTKINEWLQTNIIDNLLIKDVSEKSKMVDSVIQIKNTKEKVARELSAYLKYLGTNVQLISDVAHYDFVLLIDLLYGTALNIPDHVSKVCHDINYDIAKYLNISENEAFDISREKILKDNNIIIQGKKHNSLYDAIVMKALYHLCNK